MLILQIGSGLLFRAHQAWYLSRLIDSGDTSWTLIAGSIREDTTGTHDRLAEQKGGYTLETGTPEGKRTYEKIRSIRRIVPYSTDASGLICAGFVFFRLPSRSCIMSRCPPPLKLRRFTELSRRS